MNNETRRILLVEDEKAIRDAVAAYLERENYWVTAVGDGQEALEEFQKHHFDLVVLDLMLPRVPGERVCRAIRDNSDVPIIMLTAKGEVEDRIIGLELGADDYLAKPFGVRELLARTRALLRRSQGIEAAQPSNEVTASGITLNEDTHVAQGEKGPIDLTPREFELLSCLMHNAGKVVSREDLLHDAWGWEFITETKTVDTHIKRLRDKIEAAGYDPKLVETVRGYGYRFKK